VQDDDMHPEGKVARLQAELKHDIALTKLVMQDDKMHTEGKVARLQASDGSRYEGEFKHGLRHGKVLLRVCICF
jgi:hypothetical protein